MILVLLFSELCLHAHIKCSARIDGREVGIPGTCISFVEDILDADAWFQHIAAHDESVAGVEVPLLIAWSIAVCAAVAATLDVSVEIDIQVIAAPYTVPSGRYVGYISHAFIHWGLFLDILLCLCIECH